MNNVLDTLLTTAEAAAYLHIKPLTLSMWRVKGKGPNYSKIGKHVLYRQRELERYVRRCQAIPDVQHQQEA